MEEAPENGKEFSHSAHANGMNYFDILFNISFKEHSLKVATMVGQNM